MTQTMSPPTTPPTPIYLSTEDIAKRYNVNEDTARRWIRTGRIPGVRIGGAYRVKLDDLLRLEREGEDFTIETPVERPEVDALLQQIEDFAQTLPNGQPLEMLITQLREVLGEVPDERRILRQIEQLLHERVA
jgi:excisionase family DNA binding protein